ncbi:MAG: hypothetical protein PHW02_06995, partial [bacterium]|nr:hypothetical protein [bacterium]
MSENMRVDRDSISLLVALAEDFYNNDSFIEAINYCNMILSQFPDLKDAEILLLKCYKKLNDESSFNALSEKLLKLYPDDKALLEAVASSQSENTVDKKENPPAAENKEEPKIAEQKKPEYA